MTIHACAELVQRGDPDRFMSAMTAAPDQRDALFVLYAFNLEIARAPWVTAEAMIAEMRLQWWLDAIGEIYDGGAVRKHEVVTPLAEVIAAHGLPRGLFDDLINARRWDIYKEPHANLDAFDTYLRQTSANLIALSFLATQGGPADVPAVLEFGHAVGLANLYMAIPALENAQKYPLVDGRAEAVGILAADGLAQLRSARRNLSGVSKSARAALRAGWMAQPRLRMAAKQPTRVAANGLQGSEFSKKFRLLHLSFRNSF